MALMVEDGSGLPGAESYISLADAQAYREAYGDPSGWAAWDGASEPDRENALRRGAQYLDGNYRPKGRKSVHTQALCFPRYELTDRDGTALPSNLVPREVGFANAEAALRFLQGDLVKDLDRGDQIQSRSVAGAVEISYFPGAPAGKTFPVIDRLMSPYCRSGLETVRG